LNDSGGRAQAQRVRDLRIAMTNTASSTAPSRTPTELAGLFLLHGATSAWIGYGALMKAIEMNPQLLPSPVLKVLTEVAKAMPGDSMAFLEWSLRAIIGAEVFLAIAILLSARYARFLAIATLGLFCAILVYAMITLRDLPRPARPRGRTRGAHRRRSPRRRGRRLHAHA